MKYLVIVFFILSHAAFAGINANDKKYDVVRVMLFDKNFTIEKISSETGFSKEEVLQVQKDIKDNELTLEQKHAVAMGLLGKNNEFSRGITESLIKEVEQSKNKDVKFLADLYHTLGSSYYSEKNGLQALKYYEISINLYSQNSHVYKNLGRLYEYFSRFSDAKISYEKALKIEPDNKKVQGYLKELEEYLKANPNVEDQSESLKVQSSGK